MDDIGDIIYIDQRDGSTQLVSGDINGPELQKIQNSVKYYRAKNLGNGEVIVAETTEDRNEFIANGLNWELSPFEDYSYYGECFVQLSVPISFKCVKIGEDLFRVQWLADHKPNNSWKEVPTDKILFGSNEVVDKYSSNGRNHTDHTYNDWINIYKGRGEGYSMLKYCFSSMFKVMGLCVYGNDYFDYINLNYNFLGMSRILGPGDSLYQEAVESEIIPNGTTATLYATDVEGNPYNVEMAWSAKITDGFVKKLVLGKNLDTVVKQYGNGLYRSKVWYGGTNNPSRIYTNGNNDANIDAIFNSSFEDSGKKIKPNRLMFQGKINYTEDIDYFLSLPNE